MAPKIKYSLYLNESELEGLRFVRGEEGISESEQIRQAVRDYLKKKGVTKSDRKRVVPRSRS